jgi:hypothetical protein
MEHTGTICFKWRSYPMKNVGCAMYPWPLGAFDSVMDDALNIAMDYLIRTEQVVKLQEAQEVAAQAIAIASRFPTWQFGPGTEGRFTE